jgi:hypothetical protein
LASAWFPHNVQAEVEIDQDAFEAAFAGGVRKRTFVNSIFSNDCFKRHLASAYKRNVL